MLALTPPAHAHAAIYAIVALIMSMGFQAFSYGGFHAYVQDVAGPSGKAGLLLSITNSGGVLFGVVGNLLTGWLVQTTGSFSSVFLIAAALYVSSCIIWVYVMDEEPLH